MKSLPRDRVCASARGCGRAHVRGSDRDQSHGDGGFEDRESEKRREGNQGLFEILSEEKKLTSI